MKTSTLSSFSKLSTSQNNPPSPTPPPPPISFSSTKFQPMILLSPPLPSLQCKLQIQIYYLYFPLLHHFITTHSNPTYPYVFLLLQVFHPTYLFPHFIQLFNPVYNFLQQLFNLTHFALYLLLVSPTPTTLICFTKHIYSFHSLSVEFTSYHVKHSSSLLSVSNLK